MDELLELRKDFSEEAITICRRSEELILRTPEATFFTAEIELLRKDILGSLHTIKGNSGFMALDALKTFTHHLEDLLKAAPSFSLNSKLKTVFLETFDYIRNYCSRLDETDLFNEDKAAGIWNRLESELTECKSEQTIQNNAGISDDQMKQYQADFEKVTVKYEDLDMLLNLTGEILVSNRTLFQQIKQAGKSSVADNLMWATNRKLLALQNKIIETRSLPFSTLTKKYNRLVFDLSASTQKPVELKVINEDALVDRTILEKIHEPVIHLIRNVFAHAAEPAEERIKQGKSPVMTLTLACSDSAGSSTIEVSDDGKGISTAEVKKRAIQLGFSVSDTASDKDILSLIFRPEFSVNEKADDLSGRGIGLFVVQKTIQEIGGRIEFSSTLGAGTSFKMIIPNVFMLRDVLVFRHSDLVYGVTRDRLDKIIQLSNKSIHLVNNHSYIDEDHQLVEVTPLFESDVVSETDKYFIKFRSTSSEEFGITASKIYGYQEVIVKSIDHLWGGQKHIAGVAQVDSGELAMIIDTTQLLM